MYRIVRKRIVEALSVSIHVTQSSFTSGESRSPRDFPRQGPFKPSSSYGLTVILASVVIGRNNYPLGATTETETSLLLT